MQKSFKINLGPVENSNIKELILNVYQVENTTMTYKMSLTVLSPTVTGGTLYENNYVPVEHDQSLSTVTFGENIH